MNSSLEWNIPSTDSQALMNQYEELRELVLKKVSLSSNNSLGFSALRFRGMASWVEVLSSDLTCTSQENFPYFQEETINNIDKFYKNNVFLQSIHEEATRILTNMVMYTQKEMKGINHA